MLDSDDSAESVMSLDLSCRSDGLLVGFGARSPLQRSPDVSEQGQEAALLSSTSQRKAGWGRLFRRSTSINVEEKSLLQQMVNDDTEHYRDDDGDEYEDRYGLIRESPAPFHDRTLQQEDKDSERPLDDNSSRSGDKKFRDSTNTKSNSYLDATTRYPNDSNKPPQWQSQSFSELPARRGGGGRGGMQGFGNCDPRRENSEGFGSFFKRLYDRQEERQTMRIATEDTMEEPSWEKNIGRAAAVLLAPELCDDPDEDLDRLAMYRTIGSDVDEDDDDNDEGEEQHEWNDSKPNDEAKWKVEAQRLKSYAEKLEKELKIKDMELMSWKQRAKELQQELRKVCGREEEDSTEGQDLEDDEDSEVDEEEDEGEEDDRVGKVAEGDLLGITTTHTVVEPDKQTSLGALKTPADSALIDNLIIQQPPNLLLIMDASEPKSQSLIFDPLSANDTRQVSTSTELALISSA